MASSLKEYVHEVLQQEIALMTLIEINKNLYSRLWSDNAVNCSNGAIAWITPSQTVVFRDADGLSYLSFLENYVDLNSMCQEYVCAQGSLLSFRKHVKIGGYNHWSKENVELLDKNLTENVSKHSRFLPTESNTRCLFSTDETTYRVVCREANGDILRKRVGWTEKIYGPRSSKYKYYTKCINILEQLQQEVITTHLPLSNSTNDEKAFQPLSINRGGSLGKIHNKGLWQNGEWESPNGIIVYRCWEKDSNDYSSDWQLLNKLNFINVYGDTPYGQLLNKIHGFNDFSSFHNFSFYGWGYKMPDEMGL